MVRLSPPVFVEAEHPRGEDGKFKDKHIPRRDRPAVDLPVETAAAASGDRLTAGGPWPAPERLVCDNTAWSDPERQAVWARWEVELQDSGLASADLARIGYSLASCYARVDLDGSWPSPERREDAVEDAADAFVCFLEDEPEPASGTGHRFQSALTAMVEAVRGALPDDKAPPYVSIIAWQETKLFAGLASMASEHGSRDLGAWQNDRRVLDGYRACHEALSDYNPPPEDRWARGGGEARIASERRIRAAVADPIEESGWLATGEANLEAWVGRGGLRSLGLSESVGAFLAHRAARTAATQAGRLLAGGGDPDLNKAAEEAAQHAPEALEATRDALHERRAAFRASGAFREAWFASGGLEPGRRLESAISQAAVTAAESLHRSGLYNPSAWPWRYEHVNRARTGLAALFANHAGDDLDRLLGSGLAAADANDGVRSAPAAFFVAADDYAQKMGLSSRRPDAMTATFEDVLTTPDRRTES